VCTDQSARGTRFPHKRLGSARTRTLSIGISTKIIIVTYLLYFRPPRFGLGRRRRISIGFLTALVRYQQIVISKI
jgi:hypothetical protein